MVHFNINVLNQHLSIFNLIILKTYFFVLNVVIFVSICVWVCAHEYKCVHLGAEEDIGSIGTGVTGSCGTHNIGGRSLTWVLWNGGGHYLTTDPSLQPLSLFLSTSTLRLNKSLSQKNHRIHLLLLLPTVQIVFLPPL